jgi:YD repeat-containing protein
MKFLKVIFVSAFALISSMSAIADVYFTRTIQPGPGADWWIPPSTTSACDGVEECSKLCVQQMTPYTAGWFSGWQNAFCSFNPAYGEIPPLFGAGGTAIDGRQFDLNYYVCSSLSPGLRFNPQNNSCTPITDVQQAQRTPAANLCVGDPIFPMTGSQRESNDSGISIGGVELIFTYDSVKQLVLIAQAAVPGSVVSQTPYGGMTHSELMAFGPLWRSSLHRRLDINPSSLSITAYRGDGNVVAFTPSGNGYWAGSDVNDSLQASADMFLYTDNAHGALESYNRAGQLLSIASLNGAFLTFTYSNATTNLLVAPAPGYLLLVQDGNGRAVNFTYTLPANGVAALDGRVSTVTDATAGSVGFSYDGNGNLGNITWPDGSIRHLVYENTALTWAMTGIVDELGQRYATFGYDNAGRTTSTQQGAGSLRYSVSYATPPQISVVQTLNPTTNQLVRTYSWSPPVGTTITTPSGANISVATDISMGYPQLSNQSQPSGSGCAASNNASTFDASGNVVSKDDFQGQRTCYAYDTKNQETTRIEGLGTTTDCATVLPANATLPTNARRISTTWHPDWRLAKTVMAQGSITTTVHHGQPDPFNANAVANCTSAAVLPNGKVLPLVCKQVVQATLASGALDTSTPNVVSQSTYDASGHTLTSKDTLNRTTTYAYYASTAFTGVDPNAVGNTLGDRQSITDPQGFVTTFDSYDKMGRVLQSTDPKGVVTNVTYTPRGWISSVTTTAPGQPGRVTTYSYDAVGQVIGVTSPDGTTVSYSYDAAHRLVGATDARGNSVTYTLDNSGNRIGEQIKDPTGVLQRSIARSFDALNRVQQVTGAR